MSRKQGIKGTSQQRQKLRKTLTRSAGAIIALSMVATGLFQMESQQESTIQYATGTFAEVLSQAGSGDRLCFVSFETEYCYPCASLNQKYGEDTELGQIIHTQYAPYRVDPFNSYAGGSNMAQIYGITRIPTLLITDSDGKEIFRVEEDSQWDSLKSLLSAQAALREAPVRNSSSLITQKRSVPLSIAEDEISDAEFEEKYYRRFSLSLGRFDSYQAARDKAKTQKKQWNQTIWIQPRGQEFELLIGNFSSRKAARLTRKLLQVWENTPTKVTPLRDLPLELAPQYLSEGSAQP